MHPLRVRHEIPGHLTDRLQEALWREILHMVNDGVATTGELDESIVYGPGLRWAAMGTNLIYHLAGGETGMRHMLKQFGPCLKWPWTHLEAPELTEALIDRMVAGTQAQANGRSIRELERLRDDCLVAIQQVLRQYDIGAGATLRALETRLYEDSATAARALGAADPSGAPGAAARAEVRPDWVDYNGHMTDSRYLQVFGDATDALWRSVGVDEAYRQAGHSSVHGGVARDPSGRGQGAGAAVRDRPGAGGRRQTRASVHSLHRRRDGALIATGEQLYLHVATLAGKASSMPAAVRARLESWRAAHASLAPPAQARRHVGMPRG
jgi:carnitine 3-dehydrogenase